MCATVTVSVEPSAAEPELESAGALLLADSGQVPPPVSPALSLLSLRLFLSLSQALSLPRSLPRSPPRSPPPPPFLSPGPSFSPASLGLHMI